MNKELATALNEWVVSVMFVLCTHYDVAEADRKDLANQTYQVQLALEKATGLKFTENKSHQSEP